MITLQPELIAGLVTVMLALVNGAVAYIQWRGKTAETKLRIHAEEQQALADKERHKADLDIARINAQRQMEASNDANLQRSLSLFADLSKSFQAQTTVLDLIAERLADTVSDVDKLRQEGQIHMATEKERHESLVQALGPLSRIDQNVQNTPENTRSLLNATIKQNPELTAAIITPRLDALHAGILTAIDTLENRLIERINPDANNALMVVRRDLGDLKTECRTVFARLNDIESLLERMKPPDPPPDSPKPPQTLTPGPRLGTPIKAEDDNDDWTDAADEAA